MKFFNFLKAKGFWIAIIAATLMVTFLGGIQIGVRNNVAVKKLPVAVVDLDKGPQSQKIADKLHDAGTKKDAKIKFIKKDSVSTAKKAINEHKAYGIIVFPKNFSQKQKQIGTYVQQVAIASMTNKPEPAAPQPIKVKIIISQGSNVSASSALTTGLPVLINKLNAGMSKQINLQLAQKSVKLSPQAYSALNNLMVPQVKNINKVPDKSMSGMMPMMTTVFIWIGAMMGNMMLWRYLKAQTKTKRLTTRLVGQQAVSGILLAAIVTLVIYGISSAFSVPIPNTGSYLGILFTSVLVFFYLLSALFDWLGMGGQLIAMAVWMLSMAVAAYPKEALTAFQRDFIFSWTPIKFPMEALTNIFYLPNGSTTGSMMSIMAVIGIICLIVMFLASLGQKDKTVTA